MMLLSKTTTLQPPFYDVAKQHHNIATTLSKSHSESALLSINGLLKYRSFFAAAHTDPVVIRSGSQCLVG